MDQLLTALLATHGFTATTPDGLLRTIEQTLEFETGQVLHAHYVDPDQPKVIYCLHVIPAGDVAIRAEGLRITDLTGKIHPEARELAATLQTLQEEREAIEHLNALCDLSPPMSEYQEILQHLTGLIPEATETAATFVSFATLATDLKAKLQIRLEGTTDQPGWHQRRRQAAKTLAERMQYHHLELHDIMYLSNGLRKSFPPILVPTLNWTVTNGTVRVELLEPVKELLDTLPDAMRYNIVSRLTPDMAQRLTACQCQVLGLTIIEIKAMGATPPVAAEAAVESDAEAEPLSDEEINAQAAAEGEATIMGDGPSALEQLVTPRQTDDEGEVPAETPVAAEATIEPDAEAEPLPTES